jgi:hypothetical protein
MKRRFSTLLLVSAIGFSLDAMADAVQARSKELLSVERARLIADAEFKKITKESVKRFSVQLIKNNEQKVAFAYEDLDVPPRPGAEIYIVIEKKTGKVTWWHGR